MFIEWLQLTTWVPSGFSGYIWLDTKIVLKKNNMRFVIKCVNVLFPRRNDILIREIQAART